jgi:hypothetical protein
MVLLGDEAQVEARFGLFGDSANLDTKQVNGLPQTYHRLGNLFGHTRWNSKVTWVMSNLVLIRLDTVLVSAHDRCMVCAKHTAQESFWTPPMVLLGDATQADARFGLFVDSACLTQYR